MRRSCSVRRSARSPTVRNPGPRGSSARRDRRGPVRFRSGGRPWRRERDGSSWCVEGAALPWRQQRGRQPTLAPARGSGAQARCCCAAMCALASGQKQVLPGLSLVAPESRSLACRQLFFPPPLFKQEVCGTCDTRSRLQLFSFPFVFRARFCFARI